MDFQAQAVAGGVDEGAVEAVARQNMARGGIRVGRAGSGADGMI